MSTRPPKPRNRDQADRRTVLDVLLGRMLRGVITPAEAALLASHVREEQRLADENRRAMAGTTQALARHREAADTAIVEAEERAKKSEQQLAGYVAVFGPNAVDDFHAMQHRAKIAEGRLARICDMANNWERRLPAAVRTANVAEAVRRAAAGDDRPVMFGVTPAPANDQAAEESQQVWARRVEADLRHALDRVNAAEQRAKEAGADAERYKADALGACQTIAAMHAAATGRRGEAPARGVVEDVADVRHRAEQAEAARDRFEAAWQSARQRATEQRTLASTRQERLRIRARRILEWELRAEQADRSAKTWEDTAHTYATGMDDARRKADRYRLAWLAARRDRKADRAAMAAELPLVKAGRRALAIGDELFTAGRTEAEHDAGRRILAAVILPSPANP